MNESHTPLLPRARPSQCAYAHQGDDAGFWYAATTADIARAHGPSIVASALTVVVLAATVGTENPRETRIGRELGTPVNGVLHIRKETWQNSRTGDVLALSQTPFGVI